MDGTIKRIIIIYIQAESNLEFCLIQELVPDSGKEALQMEAPV